MSNELLINDGIAETRIALLRDGRLDDLIIERCDRPSMVGSVVLGRVSRVLNNLDIAFVDIGTGRDGFLRAPDAQYARAETDGPATQRGIARRVAEGEAIIVQIVADGYADKGPKLTTDISLPGRYVVYAPYRDMLSVSRRIDDEEERERLQDVVDEAADEAELDGGFIVRTAARSAPHDAIGADIDRIGDDWHAVIERRDSEAAPTILRAADHPIVVALRDFAGTSLDNIRVDTRNGVNRAQAYLSTVMPEFADRLEHHKGPEPLFSRDDIDGEILEMLSPYVPLGSGGSLVIEPTTALTAVDVNSGGGSGSAEETNRDAAMELARQLRLRNLSGTIVVDFIHMGDDRKIGAVLDALRRGLRGDRAPHRIGELSGFGLLELTRKRTRRSLAELMCNIGPTTSGSAPSGPPLLPSAAAAETLRRAEAEAAANSGSRVKLSVAPDVADVLNDAQTGYLATLGERTAKTIEVTANPDRTNENFEVAVE